MHSPVCDAVMTDVPFMFLIKSIVDRNQNSLMKIKNLEHFLLVDLPSKRDDVLLGVCMNVLFKNK